MSLEMNGEVKEDGTLTVHVPLPPGPVKVRVDQLSEVDEEDGDPEFSEAEWQEFRDKVEAIIALPSPTKDQVVTPFWPEGDYRNILYCPKDRPGDVL